MYRFPYLCPSPLLDPVQYVKGPRPFSNLVLSSLFPSSTPKQTNTQTNGSRVDRGFELEPGEVWGVGMNRPRLGKSLIRTPSQESLRYGYVGPMGRVLQDPFLGGDPGTGGRSERDQRDCRDETGGGVRRSDFLIERKE